MKLCICLQAKYGCITECRLVNRLERISDTEKRHECHVNLPEQCPGLVLIECVDVSDGAMKKVKSFSRLFVDVRWQIVKDELGFLSVRPHVVHAEKVQMEDAQSALIV